MNQEQIIYIVQHTALICVFRTECAQQCSAIRDALSLCKEVYSLICTSPKRLARFKVLQQQRHPEEAIGLNPIYNSLDSLYSCFKFFSQEFMMSFCKILRK